MNNTDLRTLAERILKVGVVLPANTNIEITLAEGVIHLLDENKRLSDMLAEEILGAPSVPAELRLDTPLAAPDIPDGYQEVDIDEEN